MLNALLDESSIGLFLHLIPTEEPPSQCPRSLLFHSPRKAAVYLGFRNQDLTGVLNNNQHVSCLQGIRSLPLFLFKLSPQHN